MRRLAAPAAAAAALIAASLAAPGAAYTSVLDTLAGAVGRREGELASDPGATARGLRAVARARAILGRPRLSLLDDLRYASPAARILDRSLPGDPVLDPALAAAFQALRNVSLDERAALLAWMGRTGSDRGERILDRGIYATDRWMQRGDGAATRAAAARCWRHAVRRIHRTREALRLDEPVAGPPPFQGQAPDFLLTDANPNAATSGAGVSPRDYAGMLTGWYFVSTT